MFDRRLVFSSRSDCDLLPFSAKPEALVLFNRWITTIESKPVNACLDATYYYLNQPSSATVSGLFAWHPYGPFKPNNYQVPALTVTLIIN